MRIDLEARVIVTKFVLKTTMACPFPGDYYLQQYTKGKPLDIASGGSSEWTDDVEKAFLFDSVEEAPVDKTSRVAPVFVLSQSDARQV